MTDSNRQPTIAFIGGGNMAGAIIEGMLKEGTDPATLSVIDHHAPTVERWRAKGIASTLACDSSLQLADVWVLAVKPQQLHEVVLQAKAFLRADTLVVSIAAGIDLSTLSRWFGSETAPFTQVVRAMPNTPALVQKGMTGLVATEAVSAAQRQTVTRILSTVSEVLWVASDDLIDAVTALSGSGPAYVFRFIEALIAGGEKLGLTAAQAKQMALATLAGATALAADSPETPAVLRERVTSKGGTTAAALDVLQAKGFHDAVESAMKAAYERAGELSKELGQ
jgi:pyrroline-5-carboxylate reductase